jgi:hypothetical protein
VQRAIDTGDATITRAITLVQQPYGNTPGVLLFVPVYANGAHPSTADERRASLVGLLYAPIVIAELLDGMDDIATGNVDFHLFDAASGGTLLYETDVGPVGTDGGGAFRSPAPYRYPSAI